MSDHGPCVCYQTVSTVYPKRRVRPRGRGSRGADACQQSTSSSLVCVSRFIVIFMISANELDVTWTA
ncbi:hypothetical protein Y032_0003g1671 [Ancylostoma ceylanicum]|uniref:Uncharacterized protein n=1 Tax=Ancylostoma ceylanicum TaxID=53326 RepID=A0A016VYY2_9BILA|nr:hypothetical protein Y032_0003g1671 [Ancylostoma ceylanicum]